MTSFTGAIAGGVAVLYLSPILGVNGEVPAVDKEKAAVVENDQAAGSDLNIQPTAASSTSLVSAIDTINEAVVGVVNLQQQSASFFRKMEISEKMSKRLVLVLELSLKSLVLMPLS